MKYAYRANLTRPDMAKNSKTLRTFREVVQPRWCITISYHTVPISGGSILHRQLPKLVVHLVVEVLPQEERPESKQRVHLG